MIHFPVLRTKRLIVQLKELPMIDAIAIAAIPEHMNEASTSRLLRAAVEASSGAVTDPLDWTVQERTMVVCHYMASTMDDGPDFALDQQGEVRYSHYLVADMDYAAETVPVGEIEGDTWSARHLTGRFAEAIERVSGEIEGVDARAHWLVGRMAAQLVPNDDPVAIDGDIDAALMARMRILLAYPESVFVRLQNGFFTAIQALDHLFLIDTDDSGIVIQPREATAKKPPARFPASTCITPLACAMVGKYEGAGT